MTLALIFSRKRPKVKYSIYPTCTSQVMTDAKSRQYSGFRSLQTHPCAQVYDEFIPFYSCGTALDLHQLPY